MKIKDILNYTKKERPAGGAWAGRAYLKSGKIIYISEELHSSSNIYEITEDGHIKKEISNITRPGSSLLLWFKNQPVTN